MPNTGLLARMIQKESVGGNWESVLRLVDRMERFTDPGLTSEREFLLYHRGFALLELNRHREAAEALEQLVEIDGRTAHYRLLFADSLIRAEAWQDAFRQLEAGLTSEPDHPGCLCAMGWALYQLGEKNTGKAFLLRAADAHPDYYPAHLDLGLIYAAEGRWEIGETHLHAALDSVPDDDEVRQILEAVRESREAAQDEARRIRVLWQEIRGRRAALARDESRLLREVRKRLRRRGTSHLAILLAETLWIDFAAALSRRPVMHASWGAVVVYTCEWLNGLKVRKSEVAREHGVSRFSLARRFRQVVRILKLKVGDPRYSAEASWPELPAADRSAGPVRGGAAGRNPAILIPVDFGSRERLPGSSPCPCGSGRAVSACRHGAPKPR